MRAKLKGIKESPKSKVACSIQITCSQPSDGGEMNVEMSYEGDSCLAAYLLEDAQKVINEKLEEETLPFACRKALG